MDLQFRFPPPIQLLFHEQAKSIVALQELQSEVTGLLEFKNVILQTYPHLSSKLSSKEPPNNVGSSNSSGGDRSSASADAPSSLSSWNLEGSSKATSLKQQHQGGCKADPPHRQSPPPLTTNVSDSGFGNSSSDLKESSSLNLLLRDDLVKGIGSQCEDGGLIVDDLNDDELLLLLDVIHRKTARMKAAGEKPSLPVKPPSGGLPAESSTSTLKQRLPLKQTEEDPVRREEDDIVHSVQIRTHPPSATNSSTTNNTATTPNSSVVNIKIKNGSSSSSSSSSKSIFKRSSLPSRIKIDIEEDEESDASRRSKACSSKLSELNLSKIGKTDRLDLREVGPSSLKGGSGALLVRGKKEIARDKIRKILHINNVVELQRQLLGTAIENEFYKSHMERLWETWSKRLKDFESQNESLISSLSTLKSENESLQASLSNLKSENESLKSQVLCKQKTLSCSTSAFPFPPEEEAGPSKDTIPFSWMIPEESNKGLDEIVTRRSQRSLLAAAATGSSNGGDIHSPHTQYIQPDRRSLLAAAAGSSNGDIHSPHTQYIQPDSLLEGGGIGAKNKDEFFDSITNPPLDDDDEKNNSTTRLSTSSRHGRKLLIPPNSSNISSSEYSFNEPSLLHVVLTPSSAAANDEGGSAVDFNGSGSRAAAVANASNAGAAASAELRRIPITEKLKRKILGW